MPLPKRTLLACALAVGALAAGAGPASAAAPGELDWKPCGDRFQCADLEVPLDYSRPWWRTIEIPVIKLPATDSERRIGAMVGGAGGPGGSGVDTLRSAGPTLFAPLNERFDLVAFDQRGVGMIDCGEVPDLDPRWAEPHDVDPGMLAHRARELGRRCHERNPLLLPYVTTGNAARDIDRLRVALGEKKISYLGGSYGTALGATYSSLFPGRLRAMALDAPVDLGVWMDRPLEGPREQAAGFENVLDRFAMHCATSPSCGFGGDDPEGAIDALVDRLNREPLPLAGRPGVTVDGDLVLLFLADLMYVPSLWPTTAAMLSELERGATDIAGQLFGVDLFGVDFEAFWAIMAADGDHPRGLEPYLDAVRHTWGIADHFWFVRGYSATRFGYWPVEGRGAFRGPARAHGMTTPPLIFAIRHDPATPYRWGQRMARDLGARLLTVNGEGHGAIRNPCVMQLAKRYLEDLEVPVPGVTCTQPKPFGAPAAAAAATGRGGLLRQIRRHTRWGLPVPALVGQ